MLSIVGAIIVLLCVLGGYLLHGGHFAVLIQPTEYLIIGGAGIGSLVLSSPPSLIKEILHQLTGVLKGKSPTKEEYMQLLMLMYELCKMAKANPLALEPHVEKPEESEIFRRYPAVLANHHAVHFLCDTFKVQISSPMSPYDLEALMDLDLSTAHAEEHKAAATVNRVGDAFPALGIVAAVVGIIITMGKLTQGKEVIGHSVAGALVGTMLGVLISYGFVGPLAAKMDNNISEHGKFLEVVKSAILAYAKDCSPKVCVEFARRSIPPYVRPSFEEVDQGTSNAGKAAA